jgi:predicted nucleic acid-binding protein
MNLNNENKYQSFAIDTNILIYAYKNENAEKTKIAESILTNKPYLSCQVISEFLNFLRSREHIEKRASMKLCIKLIEISQINTSSKDTYHYAYNLILKYDFQLFDAIIIADSILNNCKILYSEDMQNNLFVEKKLKIINPFIIDI